MPNTEFAGKLYFSGNTISVQGSLEPPDKNDAEAKVFAFVTQQQASDSEWPARTVTVTGQAELTSVPKPDGAGGLTYEWSLDSKAPTVHPSATGWGFDTDMTATAGSLRSGWAFGTAVLVSLQKDGTIETYAWSGWLKLEPAIAPATSLGMGTPDPVV
jgi:hypothetical protein